MTKGVEKKEAELVLLELHFGFLEMCKEERIMVGIMSMVNVEREWDQSAVIVEGSTVWHAGDMKQ